MRDYTNSIKNKTQNVNDFTTDKNYFIIRYVCGIHVIVILSTTAISPHLLPISFYLINKKTSIYFKERGLFSYSTIYSLFNTSYQIQKFRKDRSDNFFFDYDTDELWTYLDKIMDKKLFHTDPYYLLKIRNIFSYGRFCHYRALFNDIKHNLDNNVDIMCFRVKRKRNMYILVICWILD